MSKPEKQLNKVIVQSFISSTLEFKTEAILAFLNPIGSILTNVGIPFFASKTLANIMQNSDKFNSSLIYLVLVSILAVITTRIGFTRLMRLQSNVMRQLHEQVFARLLNRGIAFHTNQIGGKLISDTLDYIQAYLQLTLVVYTSGFSLVAILISGLLIVGLNSWQLGLFLLTMVSVVLIWTYFDSRRRYEARNIRLIASKKLTGHLSDSIVNAQTVKTFAAEHVEIQNNKKLNADLYRMRLNDWVQTAISGNNRIAFLVTSLVLLLILIKKLSVSSPSILSVGIFSFTYTLNLLIRLFDINVITRQLEEAMLQAAPIAQILLEEDEIKDHPNATELKVTNGIIEFINVNFKYSDNQNDQSVFDNLSIKINPGEKIGLVGPSGGGKTTLTRLLLRFSDVKKGSIEIDGQNIADVTQTSLRKSVAYVPQEPLLFHRSIKENIAYGQPNVNQKEIEDAAKLANAHDFIVQLPNGYDTVVGERGVKLSGGQRQRVAIARAILKDAPILVFDEATSALDSESEKAIQQALVKLMDNKTTIVVAHRLSTIQKMDRIIVIENGNILEQGNHQTLINNKGLYAKLWKHQSGGFLED